MMSMESNSATNCVGTSACKPL